MNEDTTQRTEWADYRHYRPVLQPHEREAARLAGVPENRRALFAYSLTGPGIARLWSLLDSGRYELHAPEEAALLCVAWLVREGELDAAAELVALLEPFADRIPFAPHPTDRPAAGTGSAHVRTTGEAARLLAQRRPNAAVAAQHEALTVWRPFEDELLAYWLRQADTSSASSGPAPADLARTQGAALLERYEALTAAHPLTGRHRDPKSNTAVLLRALSESAAGRELPPHLTGLLRSCVASMVARRGRPGSPEHTRLRLAQARQAAQPAHSELAALVRDRLAPLDPDSGLADPDAVLGPVTVEEAGQTGLTSGTAVPPAVRAVVTAALSAPPETLLACGVVTSAEPLAELAPQYLGADLALAWHPEVLDGPLRTLLTELYQGSRRFNPYLRRFARYPDLPWIRAVSPTHVREPAHAALRRLAFLALEAFPGSDPSSRLIQQLVELAQEAGIQASFFLEPFADNYTRTVTGKLMPAARVAADLLRGTPYERYYGIDYAAVRDMAEADDREGFGRLCVERAGPPGPGRPQALKPTFMPLVSDPVVIEQAMTLTTFNLAPLVHEVGVTPRAGWDALARGAFTAARRRSATPKKAARAWRHLMFHLSLCDTARQAAVLDWIDAESARLPASTAARLAPMVAGARRATRG
ncbi:hypothetical protein [Streptomyces sp. NBC_00503]|uniref:hypothetical protein n=1 Tax=Streptomyces sp. NBC_00503 TaxID=2903659 RepID=UPI002E8134B6|nr:hypothetical protein [Streptomyces sp. NBC_00503]WUD84740.1 hypothetical protein OG490_31600 [Streptomyces sp. NBC_00503]